MENSHHDIHQFYFERYLRNKLSAAEKQKLEQRLAEDRELWAAFESYKQNRKQLVTELIREHDKGPYRSRIAMIIYIVITLAGLILALNLYLENKALLAERKRDKNLITRLLEHIPFVGKKKAEQAPEKAPAPQTKPVADKVRNKVEKPVVVGEDKQPEVLLHDTVLVPISRKYVEQRFEFYRSEIDSALTDTEIFSLIYRNNHKYADKYKGAPVGVEFRERSTKNGYVFDGNKLIFFGIPSPYQVMLVRDENEVVWLQPDSELILVADNAFHSY